MASVIHFIYTGHVELDNENIVQLFAFADRMEIRSLLRVCMQFLVEHVDVHNSLGKTILFVIKFFFVLYFCPSKMLPFYWGTIKPLQLICIINFHSIILDKE